MNEPDPELLNPDRLKTLSQKIEELKAEEAARKAREQEKRATSDNMSAGARAGVELVTCITAGTLIGWTLDRTFHSAPLFLIIFLLTGICVGFYEIWRLTSR